MTKPQIATILDDGTYGQRDMTDSEIAEQIAMIQRNPQTIEPRPFPEETPTE